MEAIRRFFAAPAFDDDEKTRQAKLIHIILVSGILLSLSTLAVLPIVLLKHPVALFAILALIVVLFLGQIPLRKGYVRSVGWAIVVALIAVTVLIFIASGTIRIPAITFLLLASIVAGVTINRRAAYLSAFFNVLLVAILILAEIKGLLPKASNTVGFQQWFTFSVATIMALVLVDQSLHFIQASLENAQHSQKNAEEANLLLRKASRALESAAQLGSRIALLRDLETLLHETVEKISEQFDLYYVQVYLLTPDAHTLILQAGSGDIGKRLLRRGHRLPVDLSSVNGTAVVEQRPVIVENTETSIFHHPNPLLPETRSEMAIPLIAGERVVGVLDMQSSRPGDLTAEKLTAFDVLAGQLAVAIINAELLTEVEQARREVEQQARRLVRENWHNLLDAIHERERIAYVYNREDGAVSPLDAPLSENAEHTLKIPLEISGEPVGMLQFRGQKHWAEREQTTARIISRQAAQQIENLRLLAQAERYRATAEDAIRRLTREGWESYLEQNPMEDIGFVYQDFQVRPLSEVASRPAEQSTYPIKIGDAVIGSLCTAETAPLSPDDQELIATISGQLGAHLENLRLNAETERRVAELAIINQISTALAQTTDLDTMFTTVLEQLLQTFRVNSAYIALYDPEKQSIVSPVMVHRGEWIRPRLETHLGEGINSYIILNRETLFVNHNTDEKLRELGAIPVSGQADRSMTQSYIGVPMVVGDQVIGVLSISDSDQEGRFSETDVNLLSTIAANTAVAIQSIRSFSEVQRRAQREQALRQITSAVTSSTDPATIMRTAVQEVGTILGRRTVIRIAPAKTAEDNPA